MSANIGILWTTIAICYSYVTVLNLQLKRNPWIRAGRNRGRPSRGTGVAEDDWHRWAALSFIMEMTLLASEWGSDAASIPLYWKKEDRKKEDGRRRNPTKDVWTPSAGTQTGFMCFLASSADEEQAAKRGCGSNLVLTNCEVWLVWGRKRMRCTAAHTSEQFN